MNDLRLSAFAPRRRFSYAVSFDGYVVIRNFLTVARLYGVLGHSAVKTILVWGKTATWRKNCAALNKEEAVF